MIRKPRRLAGVAPFNHGSSQFRGQHQYGRGRATPNPDVNPAPTLRLFIRGLLAFRKHACLACGMSFNPIDYILWAQRSMNRITASQYNCDGRETGPWREQVGLFKSGQGIVEAGLDKFQIGPATQSMIITINAFDGPYVAWLHSHLPAAGIVDGPNSVDKLKAAVKAFQSKRGLTADGAVGPRTEGVMVSVWGETPPGHYGPGYKPKPAPPAPEWLKIWNIWPPHLRYLEFIIKTADTMREDYNRPPEMKDMAGILKTSAQREPHSIHYFFSSLSIKDVWNSTNPLITDPELSKSPLGTWTLSDASEKAFRETMATTSDLHRACSSPANSPENYYARLVQFQESIVNVQRSVLGGVDDFNFLWRLAQLEGKVQRLRVVRSIIQMLMKSRGHIYVAYAHFRAPVFDDAPGPMKIIMPWRYLDDVRW